MIKVRKTLAEFALKILRKKQKQRLIVADISSVMNVFIAGLQGKRTTVLYAKKLSN